MDCLMHSSLAATLGDAWSRSPGSGPTAICQADGSTRHTMGSALATLHLGALEEPTHFTVFDVACEADLILGYGWLRAHDLQFLYASNAVSICAELDVTRLCLRPPGPP